LLGESPHGGEVDPVDGCGWAAHGHPPEQEN
jgi:hypothetical protein